MAIAARQNNLGSSTVAAIWPQLPWAPATLLDGTAGFAEWQQDLQRWDDNLRRALSDVQIKSDLRVRSVSSLSTDGLATLTARIETEEITRANGDSALASQITTVIADYQAADSSLSASITTETTARVNADNALATDITNLTAAYQAADTTLQANINSEATARASADSALATDITNLTAVVGTKASISVQGVAPSSPATNDLWLDTSDQNKYKFWDGGAWQYKQDLVLAAAVSTEASARATADGFLEGKYTLTVAAGNVVTGMNITSASGGGTNVSEVAFQADKFQVYSGTSKKVMFVADSVNDIVKLGNVLTVNTASSKVYLGAGNWGNADTGFYVDSTGQFSLKDKLTWNGTTLAVDGTITSTSGTIGGFTLAANKLSTGSGTDYVELNSSSNPVIRLGESTGDNIAMLGGFASGTPELRVNFGSAARVRIYRVGGVFDVGRIDLNDSSSGLLTLTGTGSVSGNGTLSFNSGGPHRIAVNRFVGDGMDINQYGSGDRNSVCDFWSEDSPASGYSARILRQPGVNGQLDIVNAGTGDINIAPASGVLRFGTHTAIGAETVTGYITIKDSGGATRKLAVVS